MMLKRTQVSILMFLFCSLTFISCFQKHSCVNSYIHPAFIGFSSSDIDTIILRAYKPNENFQHRVDTILVTNKGASIYTNDNDTTIIYQNDSDPNHWIRQGLDWELYIPAKNKTIRITNINGTQVEGKGRVCYNPINSFTVNGQKIIPIPVQTDEFYTSGYRVYIHN